MKGEHPPPTDRSHAVLLVGTDFIGVVHSQAWRTVVPVFGPAPVRLACVVGRDIDKLERFASRGHT